LIMMESVTLIMMESVTLIMMESVTSEVNKYELSK
jgi:hypothetical protein